MQDRYGNPLSTGSNAAALHYRNGMDLFLAAQPGAVEALQCAVQEDPDFAVAHADLARTLQILAQPAPARASMALAQEAAARNGELSTQEALHVEIVGLLVAGKGAQAYAQIKTHVREFPRDVMVAQPACGVFGLIGFSGRNGREAENLAFMQSLAHAYEDDWWFESQYAFAWCETGQLQQAEALLDSALALYPNNANAIHHRAHIRYELGETEPGCEELTQWRASYPRDGLLHCHLAWHEALWRLALGDHQRVWDIVLADIHPDVSSSLPINVMTDLVALLLRAEIAGVPRRDDLWERVAGYAREQFPRAGLSFVDMHSAIAQTVTGNDVGTALFKELETGFAADLVRHVTTAFRAFKDQDWSQMIVALTPAMVGHERLGGSRAQRDLLELAYAYALVRTDSRDHALRFLQTRRPLLATSKVLQ